MSKRFLVSERGRHYRACLKCSKRAENCHSNCEEYAAEVILGIMLEPDAKKATQKRADEYAVRERKAICIAKSCPGSKKRMRASGYIRKQGR